ncbi:MAG: hypothetical protein IPL58_16695 [Betaproteobacteria bacterium]|uniref:Uncharacterized protein n=1 Tax=Candidatus Proximibacter danicus TaxID=2954365 RepID=A0A9D7PSP0_9PROT|nr:hypothetical protein [Candidatus Proximibacter danicus]
MSSLRLLGVPTPRSRRSRAAMTGAEVAAIHGFGGIGQRGGGDGQVVAVDAAGAEVVQRDGVDACRRRRSGHGW